MLNCVVFTPDTCGFLKDLPLFLLLITHMGCIIDADAMSGTFFAEDMSTRVFILIFTDSFLKPASGWRSEKFCSCFFFYCTVFAEFFAEIS